MSIKQKKEELIETFSLLENWQDKYEYLIDMARTLPTLPENQRSEDLLIKGCQAQVWLKALFEGQNIHYQGDSDAILPKGLIALVLHLFNEENPTDILNTSYDFLDDLELKSFLSPTRANGLQAMIKQIKMYALTFNALHQQEK